MGLNNAEVESSIDRVIQVIKQRNHNIVIVLAAMFTFPFDPDTIQQNIWSRNRWLDVRAREDSKVRFFNGNLAFYKYGHNKILFDSGRCTLDAVIILGRALKNWL